MAKSSNVRGFLFRKADYNSIEAWRDAGYPQGVSVRDTPYWLKVSGIPIVDAMEVSGRYIKLPEGSKVPMPEKVKLRKVQVSKIAIPHTELKYEQWKNLLPNLKKSVQAATEE